MISRIFIGAATFAGIGLMLLGLLLAAPFLILAVRLLPSRRTHE